MKCIYCNKDEKQASFNSREHVIPAAIGTFGAGDKTPTLINMVCDECNQKMGDELETSCIRTSYLELFRSGALGTLRYQDHHLKSKKIKKSAFLDIRAIHNTGIGDKLSLVLDSNDRRIDLQNSISFKQNDNGKWETYSLDYLIKNKELLKRLNETRNALKNKEDSLFFVHDSKKSLEQMVSLLETTGFKFKIKDSNGTIYDLVDQDGQILTEISTIFNDLFYRFIAKIAFNYFVKYVLNELSVDIFDKSIDKLRRFIRYGEKNEEIRITPTDKPKLHGQNKRVKYPNCFHMVCVEGTNGKFCAYVNLYNSIGYELELFEYPNIKNDYFIGHHFDFIHNDVHRITNIRGLRKKGILVYAKPTNPLPKLVVAKPKIILPNIWALLKFGK
jgi:hypothetical protein